MEAWATAADLSKIFNVKPGTIYAWASTDGWRRTKTSRPRRYSATDAQASYEKRHAEGPTSLDNNPQQGTS